MKPCRRNSKSRMQFHSLLHLALRFRGISSNHRGTSGLQWHSAGSVYGKAINKITYMAYTACITSVNCVAGGSDQEQVMFRGQ